MELKIVIIIFEEFNVFFEPSSGFVPRFAFFIKLYRRGKGAALNQIFTIFLWSAKALLIFTAVNVVFTVADIIFLSHKRTEFFRGCTLAHTVFYVAHTNFYMAHTGAHTFLCGAHTFFSGAHWRTLYFIGAHKFSIGAQWRTWRT